MTESEKAFIKAAKKGDVEKLMSLLESEKALLAARDTDLSTALHCATWKSHREVIIFLLKA